MTENLKKHDISSEEWREYEYAEGNGWANGIDEYVYLIPYPVTLYVSHTGSHRVVDKLGITHYMPSGWRVIRWRADPEVEF